MTKTALVIGGAKCVWSDLNTASIMGFEPDIIVVVNDIGIEFASRFDYWCSYHSDMLQIWYEKRQKQQLPKPSELVTGPVKPRHIKMPMRQHKIKGGSSGMLGVFTALDAGAEKIIICGIPLDPKMPHFNSKQQNRPWSDAVNYQKHWHENLKFMKGKVKSFGGFTGTLLGKPTIEWIDQ